MHFLGTDYSINSAIRLNAEYESFYQFIEWFWDLYLYFKEG